MKVPGASGSINACHHRQIVCCWLQLELELVGCVLLLWRRRQLHEGSFIASMSVADDRVLQ